MSLTGFLEDNVEGRENSKCRCPEAGMLVIKNILTGSGNSELMRLFLAKESIMI